MEGISWICIAMHEGLICCMRDNHLYLLSLTKIYQQCAMQCNAMLNKIQKHIDYNIEDILLCLDYQDYGLTTNNNITDKNQNNDDE